MEGQTVMLTPAAVQPNPRWFRHLRFVARQVHEQVARHDDRRRLRRLQRSLRRDVYAETVRALGYDPIG